jgi:hypothetical protein
MLHSYIFVIESLGLASGTFQHFLERQCIRKGVGRFPVRPKPPLHFNFRTRPFQVESRARKNTYRKTLSQMNQSKQQMFGINDPLLKPRGFFASQCQYLARPGCEALKRLGCQTSWKSFRDFLKPIHELSLSNDKLFLPCGDFFRQNSKLELDY